jgi:hypothetical protein
LPTCVVIVEGEEEKEEEAEMVEALNHLELDVAAKNCSTYRLQLENKH